jgi:hypothetical protein
VIITNSYCLGLLESDYSSIANMQHHVAELLFFYHLLFAKVIFDAKNEVA